MLVMVKAHPRYGYRRIWRLLRQEGFKVNRKRIYRLWRQEGLKVPVKRRKRRSSGEIANGITRLQASHKDQVWTWDFIHDRTEDGRPLKLLSIVDEYTRECVALEVGRHYKSVDIIEVLIDLFMIRGIPQYIRSDNGPEFIAKAIKRWLGRTGVKSLYVEPGSPWQNGYVESFHSRVRDEFLNTELFTSIAEAKLLAMQWRLEYNHRRPHSSLGYVTPAAFAASHAAASLAALGKPQHATEEAEILS